jgi:hypothetical protein
VFAPAKFQAQVLKDRGEHSIVQVTQQQTQHTAHRV